MQRVLIISQLHLYMSFGVSRRASFEVSRDSWSTSGLSLDHRRTHRRALSSRRSARTMLRHQSLSRSLPECHRLAAQASPDLPDRLTQPLLVLHQGQPEISLAPLAKAASGADRGRGHAGRRTARQGCGTGDRTAGQWSSWVRSLAGRGFARYREARRVEWLVVIYLSY